MGMLRQFAPDVWISEQPQRYLGVELGIRMTVVRVANGGLFVHSPIRLVPALRSELEAIAPVRFIVAPNRFHHLFAAEFARSWPEAELYCAPGLEKKRPDLKGVVLGDDPPAGWAGSIDQIVFRAFPPLNEVNFFHRASRTLILTDLLFNFSDSHSGWTKIALALDGGLHGPSVPRSFRTMLRFKKRQCRPLLNRILEWEFDRIVLAHGEPIIRDAKGIFAAAWSFVK